MLDGGLPYNSLILIFHSILARLSTSNSWEGDLFHEFKKQVLNRNSTNLNIYVERYCEDLSDGKIGCQFTSRRSGFDGLPPSFDEEVYHLIRPLLQAVWKAEKAIYGETREVVVAFFKRVIDMVGADVKPYAKVY